jgi:LysM repeat protein
MENRITSPARALATIALVVGFIALVVVFATSLGGGSGGGVGGQGRVARHASQSGESKRPVPAAYLVKSGDTLTSIAHRTGVPVARIERLNPETDPQILIAGEKLKLK